MPIDQENIFAALKDKLCGTLPGERAQRKMAPDGRRLRFDQNGEPLQGAVLILLYPEDGLNVIMIERAKYDGVHSGQIAFPGGKKENEDVDLQHTALRETFEEIGVRSSEVHILGKLSRLYIPVSNICVFPFVGLLEKPLQFKIDRFEVQRIIQIKVKELMDPTNCQVATFTGKNYTIEAPCYMVGGVKIWGASAMMLSELLELFK